MISILCVSCFIDAKCNFKQPLHLNYCNLMKQPYYKSSMFPLRQGVFLSTSQQPEKLQPVRLNLHFPKHFSTTFAPSLTTLRVNAFAWCIYPWILKACQTWTINQ